MTDGVNQNSNGVAAGELQREIISKNLPDAQLLLTTRCPSRVSGPPPTHTGHPHFLASRAGGAAGEGGRFDAEREEVRLRCPDRPRGELPLLLHCAGDPL
ncbi:hypothetical protein ACIQNG_26370 [Streptomyces sp. NPDC091377]|uniref:hypothetical protein n=1 Tax=Streptomyces sp. NPDC091377 TaxID=3365995 RepID=UPI003825ED9B